MTTTVAQYWRAVEQSAKGTEISAYPGAWADGIVSKLAAGALRCKCSGNRVVMPLLVCACAAADPPGRLFRMEATLQAGVEDSDNPYGLVVTPEVAEQLRESTLKSLSVAMSQTPSQMVEDMFRRALLCSSSILVVRCVCVFSCFIV